MKKLLFPSLCIIALLVSGCSFFNKNTSSSSSSSSQPTSSSSSSSSSSLPDPELTLSSSSVKVKVDHSTTITATAKNGTGMVTWTSNDASIATVNNGTITGKKVGTTYITARYSGITAKCDVEVEPNVILNLSKVSMELNVGGSDTITASASGGSGDVSWTSNNTGVATVTKLSATTASVSGIASGNAIITANYSGVVKSCSVHISDGSVRPTTGTTTIKVFATNDFHGAVEQSGSNMGLGKWATYLNNKGQQDNTLLIDQGDTWQGSIYSNYNHGALITDVMNYIHYDARSVGNHDFDWGTDALAANTARSYAGYSTPILAGNVHDYTFNTHTEGNIQQSNLGGKSVVYTLENGIKVGILGGIGSSQITSICSSYTMDICFKDHIAFIKREATYLRNTENCDVIIASMHAPQDEMTGNGLASYVDLVLCGHSHHQETTNEGNLWYNQNLAYGQSIGEVTLTFDYSTNKVTGTSISVHSCSDVLSEVSTVETNIQSIINNYSNQCNTESSEVLASKINGYFPSSGAAANLMTKAIFDRSVSEGYNVDLVMVNSARKAIYNSNHPYSWTYAEIYESFPFDNTVYIADVKGSELKKELGYNYIYRNASFTNNNLSLTGTYRIAVIDYVYLHTGETRYYDYFSITGGTSSIALTKNYREIIKQWLKDNHYNTGTQLNSDDFSSSLWAHNTSNFTFS